MAQSLAPASPLAGPALARATAPSESARGTIAAGLAILIVFFGGFGAWSLIAPLNGAVIGNAVVEVEGNRKAVQHPDGGVVKDLRVKEGDHVNAGDVLLVLDDSQARSDFEVFSQQQDMLLATEARLRAELDGAQAIGFPPELAASTEASARTAQEGQREEFESRRAALSGQQAILSRRVDQLNAQIAGNDAEAEAYRRQLASAVAEEDSLADLLKNGLITRSRILDLQRAEEALNGQIGAAEAASAQARQAITELGQQTEQLARERTAEDTNALRDVQTRLLEVAPRVASARVLLDRMEVRSPYAGQVVGLSVFGTGAVVARGEKILDVVPDGTPLVVQAQIGVEDIADLKPGMPAEVHFTAYRQRVAPLLHGTVTQVSADRLTDNRTGAPYYVATVAVDPKELAASPEIKLYPGMPATVMVTTEKRTAFDYLVGPLTASFDRSFRQK